MQGTYRTCRRYQAWMRSVGCSFYQKDDMSHLHGRAVCSQGMPQQAERFGHSNLWFDSQHGLGACGGRLDGCSEVVTEKHLAIV